MIVTAPDLPASTLPRSPLRKRELQRFLTQAAAAAGLRGSVSVLLAGDATLRQLNRDFRGKDKPTDVLSFPAAENGAGRRYAGDLAVSLETAARQAGEFGHELATEVKILLLHGVLHLSGMDHEKDSGEMARLEARLRRHFGLPLGLIQRVEGAGIRDQGSRSGRKAATKQGAKATAKKRPARHARSVPR